MTSKQDIKWEKYRFNDFFRGVEGQKRHERFPNTIIYKYYKRTSEQSNYEVLSDVIDSVQKSRRIEMPETDCCVIHLRTGDVIDNGEFSVDQLLSKNRYYQYRHGQGGYIEEPWNSYVKTLKYYEDVVSKLQKFGIKKVSFSYNLEWNPYAESKNRKIYLRSYSNEKSTEYVRRICDLFAEHSFNIVPYQCKDMDYDLVYMCHSSVFVPSGGGLSSTIAKIVTRRGNRVVYGVDGISD